MHLAHLVKRVSVDYFFEDKDLAHCSENRQGIIYVQMNLCQIFDKYLPCVQHYFTKTLPNL